MESFYLDAPAPAPTAPASGGALTQGQLARLAYIARRATKYEAIAIRQDGERRRIGYTARHSLPGLLALTADQGPAVAAFLALTAETGSIREGLGVAFDNGAAVRFSGRTERQAIMEGELPGIAPAPAAGV